MTNYCTFIASYLMTRHEKEIAFPLTPAVCPAHRKGIAANMKKWNLTLFMKAINQCSNLNSNYEQGIEKCGLVFVFSHLPPRSLFCVSYSVETVLCTDFYYWSDAIFIVSVVSWVFVTAGQEGLRFLLA